MKNIKASPLLMATALVIFFYQQAQAQTILRQSVFGNGGTASSNGTYRLSGTAGQTVIGVTSSSSYIGKQGFWYSLSNTGAPTENLPPYVVNPTPDQTLTVGASLIRDLNAAPVVFSDPDGDALSYSATSSDPTKTTVTISGSTLTVAPVAAGSATITVTANDNKGGTTPTTFAVTVNPPANCWINDPFDNLNSSPLHGQSGWQAAAGRASAIVVVNPFGSGKILLLDPGSGQTIVMNKDVPDQASGIHTLELMVRVQGGVDHSMAKLEVQTSGNSWGKKFQLYFGVSMRLNNSPSSAVTFLSTVNDQWYRFKTVIDPGTNRVDLYVDDVLILNDVAVGAGPITSISISAWDLPGRVYLDDIRGCHGGLMKASASGKTEASLKGVADAIPSSFELEQNYPNPFNPQTTIQYAIPAHSHPGGVQVTLRIYNLQGQVVRTLVDEQKSPGHYHVVWDGKNDAGMRISSGVYLYTITAGDFKATKRMTILK